MSGLSFSGGNLMGTLFGSHNPGVGSDGKPVPATAPAPTTANSNAPAPAAQTPAVDNSPIANLPNLWETPKDKDGKEIQPPVDPLAQNIFQFNPVTVKEQAAKLDFVSGVPQELVEKAAAGGAEGVGAILQIIQQVQQQAFAAGTLNAGNLVNQALLKNNGNLKEQLADHIRSTQVRDTPISDPILSNEKVKPLVVALREAVTAKNPGMPAAEVTKQVNDYLLGLGAALKDRDPADPTVVLQKAKEPTDFLKFMSGR